MNEAANSKAISTTMAWRALAAFLVIGFALRLWIAVTLPRIAQADEIYQSQEPAHYLAYGYGLFTWEWREGIRSWVLPAVLAGVMRATAWLGPGSSGYLLGIKIVLSLLSLTTIGFAFAFARRASGNEAAIIAAGCCAMWFSLVDYGPRALTEVVSAHLLLPALYLGVYGERIDQRVRLFAAGVLCGMAACLRVQYGPAIAFALLYFCFRGGAGWLRRAWPLALGVLLPVIGFGLADWVTWGHAFSSFVGYFQVNVLQGRAAQFGVLPWYWYLSDGLLQALGPLPFFALFGLRRSPFLAWMAAIVLATHSLIGHKEVRFLYAMWPMVITLAAIGTVELAAALNRRLKRPLSAQTVVWGSLSLSPIVLAGVLIGFHYIGHPQGSMFLFDQLSREPEVCGVAELELFWTDGGGYTHLHRDVPILYLRNEAEMNGSAQSFNALVSHGTLSSPPHGFTLRHCVAKYCLYERAGGCGPAPPESEMNEYLRLTGQ